MLEFTKANFTSIIINPSSLYIILHVTASVRVQKSKHEFASFDFYSVFAGN